MAGDMVVLPCGANDTPRRLQYVFSVLLLCSIADANITAIGYGTSESKMFHPVRPTAAVGNPFGVDCPDGLNRRRIAARGVSQPVPSEAEPVPGEQGIGWRANLAHVVAELDVEGRDQPTIPHADHLGSPPAGGGVFSKGGAGDDEPSRWLSHGGGCWLLGQGAAAVAGGARVVDSATLVHLGQLIA